MCRKACNCVLSFPFHRGFKKYSFLLPKPESRRYLQTMLVELIKMSVGACRILQKQYSFGEFDRGMTLEVKSPHKLACRVGTLKNISHCVNRNSWTKTWIYSHIIQWINPLIINFILCNEWSHNWFPSRAQVNLFK